MNNTIDTNFRTLFLTLTLLLDEIHLSPTTLREIHFQSGVVHIYFTH